MRITYIKNLALCQLVFQHTTDDTFKLGWLVHDGLIRRPFTKVWASMWKNHEDNGGVDHTTGLTARGRNSCRSSEAESGKHRNLEKSSDHQWERGTET